MPADFDSRGYLGDQASEFKALARGKYKPYFELFEELNSFSQDTKFKIQVENQNGQQVLSANIFVRILNGAQTVYILCGYGLAQEAQVVLRSLLEGLIILAKIVSDSTFVRSYILEDEINRLKLMEAAQKRSHPAFEDLRKEVSPEKVSSLRDSIKAQKVTRINLFELAEQVGLGAYYDSIYRLLSPAVHVRARSLEDYLRLDEAGEMASIEWGPQHDDVPIILGTCMDILVRSWGAIDHLFGLGLNQDLKTYMEKLKTLQG